MTKLEIKQVRKYLKYDKLAGGFTWIRSPSRRAKVGKTAGCINSQGYVVIRLQGRLYLAHRLAFLLECGFLPICIDHINRNKADNRISNLRSATIAENNENRDILSNNTSGKEGVSFSKTFNKYVAYIDFKGKRKTLGYRKTLAEAAELRVAAEIALTGKEKGR